jgi:hypothetical protein
MSAALWTTEDDERLRSLAQSGIGLSEISRRMKRAKYSVRSRASKLDIPIARDRIVMQPSKRQSVSLSSSG